MWVCNGEWIRWTIFFPVSEGSGPSIASICMICMWGKCATDIFCQGRVYLAAMFAAAYDAPMEQLCAKVVDGLNFLNNRAEKAR